MGGIAWRVNTFAACFILMGGICGLSCFAQTPTARKNEIPRPLFLNAENPDSSEGSEQQSPTSQQPAGESRGVKPATPISGDSDLWKSHKDQALLFATNDYDHWQHLVNPISDAKSIAESLRDKFGFEVEVVKNPSKEEIFSRLREYTQKKFAPGDQLLIFFAGHGLYDDTIRQGFIVSRDSKAESEDLNRSSFLTYDDLRARIDAIPAKHILLVLDACFSGTFDRKVSESSMRGGSPYPNLTISELYKDKAKLATRLYFTSGGKDYVPDGTPGNHSPFTARILAALESYGGDKGFLTYSDLKSDLQLVKPEPLGGEWAENAPGSEFFFISKKCSESGCGLKEESASKPGLPSQPKAVSVAVMGFKNLTGKPEAALVSDVLAGQISMELVARGDVRTVSDELITNTKAQLPLADANSYGKETLSELGRLLEADYIVTGSYESNGEPGKGEITLNLVIQNAFTGETLAVLPEKGTQANVRELATRGGGWVHDKLPISAITSSNSAAAKGSSTLNPDAERFYRDGLNKLASNNLLAARDSLQKAVAAAPDFAMGQAALSKAWFELGYDQNAREAAEKAYELSKKMASFEDRLILEGNYRERNGEWDRAIEIYGELCNGFPEDVNYALELARIQTDSGKAKAALETLANLRNRVASSEQDPRIDLQEAIAAEALANAELQQKSAASAAQKANRLGARFLEAEAFWQQCSAFQNLGKPEEAEQTCQKANQLSDMAAGQKLRARSLSALANLRDSQSQFDEAHELREEALLIAQKTGSQKDIVGALLNLANSESRVGRMADAKAHREKAISVAEAIGDKSQLLKVLNDEATYLSSQGEYQEAMDMYGRAFSLATEIGDQDGIGMSLVNRGALHIQIGEISAAEEDLKKAKAISTRAGLMDILGPALNGLGDVKVAQADFDAAENEYQEGRKVFEQLHDSANLANNILSLASLCLEKGDISRAESLARSAVEQFQTLALGDAEAAARETLARALLAQTRIPDARAELDRADGLHPQDHGIAISVMSTQALLLAANHQPKEALDLFSKAGESAHQFHLLGQELEIALWKLRERGKQGEPASAIEIQAIRGKAEKNGLKLVASRADELHAELTRKK